MNAIAPAINTGLEVNLTLTADGVAIDSDQIVSVETWRQANRVPRARIVLYDGDPATGKFPFSEAKTFIPGAKLELSVGYGSDTTTIHRGVVIRHALRIRPGVSARLIVETADPILKMTVARHSAVSEKSTDAALIAALVGANGGSVGTNEAGTDQIEAIVQAYASDWDLLLMRAEASGCVVFVDDSKVDIVSPMTKATAALELEYGDSIVSLDAVIDAGALLGDNAVSSRAWSYADQKVTKASAAGVSVGVPGNLAGADLAKVLDVDAFPQQTAAARDAAALTAWSSARLMRAKLAQVVGTASFQGSAAAKPGTHVSLKNLGARFNGDAFVSGVRHAIHDGDWMTTVEFGLPVGGGSPGGGDIAGPPAAGLAPPLKGLHTGLVAKVATDPNGDFRVLVTLPLTDDANGLWARLAQPYASKGFGWSFFPEVGDEVLLAFMNEDASSPVIVASVYSNQRAAKYPPNETNDIKSLVTRSRMEIKFDDKDTILTISTPGGRVITLDDKAGAITVKDAKDNKLVMTDQGIDLLSSAALNIKSKGAMTIDSGATLTVTAKAAYDLSAAKITATGKGGLDLVSNAMASLKAAAILEVKGALVKIN